MMDWRRPPDVSSPRHIRRGGGQVYVVGSPRRLGVKIGWSTTLDRRLVVLAASLKSPVELLYATEKMLHGYRVERRAHELLIDRRLGHEWFDADLPEAKDAIRRAEADVLSGWEWPRLKCHDVRKGLLPPKDWPDRWRVDAHGRKRK